MPRPRTDLMEVLLMHGPVACVRAMLDKHGKPADDEHVAREVIAIARRGGATEDMEWEEILRRAARQMRQDLEAAEAFSATPREGN